MKKQRPRGEIPARAFLLRFAGRLLDQAALLEQQLDIRAADFF